MSLYQVQKFLYELNRNAAVQARFQSEKAALLDDYRFTAEEREALENNDIGLLYVLSAHPSLLIHFAGVVGIPITEHRQTLRDGVRRHGPVRAGIMSQIPDDGL